MELKDTVKLMCSDDWKDRMSAEYAQLILRRQALMDTLSAMQAAQDDPTKEKPDSKCPVEMLDNQFRWMEEYRMALEQRMAIEGVVFPEGL